MTISKIDHFDSFRVNFKGKGVAGTVTAGQTGNIDLKLTERRFITGLQLLLKDHTWGDTAKLQIVDVDNILGYGAGTVLAEYATDWQVCSDKQDQGIFSVPYPADIATNLYLRVAYTSTGGTNVGVRVNYFLHKALA
jgi:hypothetical protein